MVGISPERGQLGAVARRRSSAAPRRRASPPSSPRSPAARRSACPRSPLLGPAGHLALPVRSSGTASATPDTRAAGTIDSALRRRRAARGPGRCRSRRRPASRCAPARTRRRGPLLVPPGAQHQRRPRPGRGPRNARDAGQPVRVGQVQVGDARRPAPAAGTRPGAAATESTSPATCSAGSAGGEQPDHAGPGDRVRARRPAPGPAPVATARAGPGTRPAPGCPSRPPSRRRSVPPISRARSRIPRSPIEPVALSSAWIEALPVVLDQHRDRAVLVDQPDPDRPGTGVPDRVGQRLLRDPEQLVRQPVRRAAPGCRRPPAGRQVAGAGWPSRAPARSASASDRPSSGEGASAEHAYGGSRPARSPRTARAWSISPAGSRVPARPRPGARSPRRGPGRQCRAPRGPAGRRSAAAASARACASASW